MYIFVIDKYVFFFQLIKETYNQYIYSENKNHGFNVYSLLTVQFLRHMYFLKDFLFATLFFHLQFGGKYVVFTPQNLF